MMYSLAGRRFRSATNPALHAKRSRHPMVSKPHPRGRREGWLRHMLPLATSGCSVRAGPADAWDFRAVARKQQASDTAGLPNTPSSRHDFLGIRMHGVGRAYRGCPSPIGSRHVAANPRALTSRCIFRMGAALERSWATIRRGRHRFARPLPIRLLPFPEPKGRGGGVVSAPAPWFTHLGPFFRDGGGFGVFSAVPGRPEVRPFRPSWQGSGDADTRSRNQEAETRLLRRTVGARFDEKPPIGAWESDGHSASLSSGRFRPEARECCQRAIGEI